MSYFEPKYLIIDIIDNILKPVLIAMDYFFQMSEKYFDFRGDSKMKNSFVNVDQTFGWGGVILLQRLDFTCKLIEF